jgi:hypothetical protein
MLLKTADDKTKRLALLEDLQKPAPTTWLSTAPATSC